MHLAWRGREQGLLELLSKGQKIWGLQGCTQVKGGGSPCPQGLCNLACGTCFGGSQDPGLTSARFQGQLTFPASRQVSHLMQGRQTTEQPRKSLRSPVGLGGTWGSSALGAQWVQSRRSPGEWEAARRGQHTLSHDPPVRAQRPKGLIHPLLPLQTIVKELYQKWGSQDSNWHRCWMLAVRAEN